MAQDPFFDQPYSNRQLVLFTDEKAISTKENSPPLSTLGRFILAVNPATVFVAVLLEAYLAAKKEGVENLNLVEKSKINLFQLPPGHPRNGVVYAGHPGIPIVYVPLADFHRLTFEHKFAEAVSLLMHLGAKTLKVEHVAGWGTEFSSRLSVGLPAAVPNMDIGAEAGSRQHSKRAMLFQAAFNNKQEPCLPPNMVWYPYEATWQQVADGRLKFGMSNFSLTLNYKDDYGLNAGLKLKLEKAGLDLGGTFEKLVETTWSLSGDF